MPEEKYDDLIGVKCHKRYRDALKRVAAAVGVESEAELLRSAGRAILEYAAQFGENEVPKDMAIWQAKRGPDFARWLAAEGSVSDTIAQVPVAGAGGEEKKSSDDASAYPTRRAGRGSSGRGRGGKR